MRAAVHGVFSLTEMEIVFRNPHGRRMEGRFTAVLPEGATVSRFAKEVDGRLMEGEVVERLRANRVYAEILHQMRDPALLEQDQGNRFSARIFPIEAGARVRVVLGLHAAAADGIRRPHLSPAPARPAAHRRAAADGRRAAPAARAARRRPPAPEGSRAGEDGTLAWENEQFTPTEDLEFRWSPRAGRPARVPGAGRAATTWPACARTWLPRGRSARRAGSFFIDTSASAAEGMDHRLAALRAVLAALPGRWVELVAFDQQVRSLGTFHPRAGGGRASNGSCASAGCWAARTCTAPCARWRRARRGSRTRASCW